MLVWSLHCVYCVFNVYVLSGISENLNIPFYCCVLLTGSHISEVLQENEALKQHVEQLELQSQQDKEALQADAVQAKEELCRYVCIGVNT